MINRLVALLGFGLMLVSNSEPTEWPDLPTSGFIVGRAATVEDVAAGSAVLSMKGDSLGPIAIDIPQYVFWADEGGNKRPMILIQAEKAPGGMQIVGLRAFDGTEAAATLGELTLLGKEKPRQ